LEIEIKDIGSKECILDKKERILLAAESLFSKHGFEGVSTRALAREAGVNIAMLSYYFGSKEKLYEATIHFLMDKRRDDMNKLAGTLQSPIDKVYALIDFYVDKVFGQGVAYKIFMREVSQAQSPEICEDILQFFMGNMNIMKQIFVEGVEKGVFRKVDIEMTILSLIGTVHHLTHTPALTQRMFNLNFDEPVLFNIDLKNRLKKHLKDLLKVQLIIPQTQI
jgi:AcrR family transcriptional regulator